MVRAPVPGAVLTTSTCPSALQLAEKSCRSNSTPSGTNHGAGSRAASAGLERPGVLRSGVKHAWTSWSIDTQAEQADLQSLAKDRARSSRMACSASPAASVRAVEERHGARRWAGLQPGCTRRRPSRTD